MGSRPPTPEMFSITIKIILFICVGLYEEKSIEKLQLFLFSSVWHSPIFGLHMTRLV